MVVIIHVLIVQFQKLEVKVGDSKSNILDNIEILEKIIYQKL